MSPALSRKAFAELGAPSLVYVRPLRAGDLDGDAGLKTPHGQPVRPDQILYGVYGADGERLAVMLQREEAFAAAMAYELAPVSVH